MSNHTRRSPRYYKTNVDVYELCVWMFERMKDSPPFMKTSEDFSKTVQRLIDQATRGDVWHAQDWSWSMHLEGLYFVDETTPRYRTSAKIFHFLASLGEALQVDRCAEVEASLEKLLELLVGCQDTDRRYLQLEGESDDWQIISTPLGEEAFGQPIEIRFRERCPLDNFIFWSLPMEGTEAYDELAG